MSDHDKLNIDDPEVSVILPIRNEGKYIEKCLSTIMGQDYDLDKIEILIVDGDSEDNTKEIVKKICAEYKNVKLLHNPRGIVSTGMNIGIRNAKGNVIVRVDGHTVLEKDYIIQGIEYLKKTQADNVGGLMRATGTTYLSRVIAFATSSPFGVGDGAFHYSIKEQYVDTVYMGIYPMEVFHKIGLFDEELVRNQDDELNYRLRKAGGRIFMTPQIKSNYYNRGSLKSLWRQYFQYGFWKIRVFQKHPKMMQLRQFIPACFALSIMTCILLSSWNHLFLYLLLSILLSYIIFNFFSCFRIAKRESWKYLPMLPIVFATLHLSYGTGFSTGLVKFFAKWFKEEPGPPNLSKNHNK